MPTVLRSSTILLAIGVITLAGMPRWGDGSGPEPVLIVPVDLELGTVSPRSPVAATWYVTNPTDRLWSVVRVESSCPCVTVSPALFEVKPESTTALTITFDPSTEPDFRGRLLVTIRGLGADGRAVCTARVAVAVEN